jgi:hypothetical protein
MQRLFRRPSVILWIVVNMARTTTLTNLLEDIRTQYEIRSISLSDSVLTRWINNSIAELYDVIIEVRPDHYISSANLTIISGTDSYSLPSTFYKMHGVDVLNDDGRYYAIQPFIWEDRNLYGDSSSDKRSARYRIMGGNVVLAPKPTWAGTVRLNFIPYSPLLTTGASTWDGFNGWEEYVIIDVCIKAALKEDSDARQFQSRKDELMRRIRSIAKTRDYSHGDKIRDTRLQNVNSLYPWKTLPRP